MNFAIDILNIIFLSLSSVGLLSAMIYGVIYLVLKIGSLNLEETHAKGENFFYHDFLNSNKRTFKHSLEKNTFENPNSKYDVYSKYEFIKIINLCRAINIYRKSIKFYKSLFNAVLMNIKNDNNKKILKEKFERGFSIYQIISNKLNVNLGGNIDFICPQKQYIKFVKIGEKAKKINEYVVFLKPNTIEYKDIYLKKNCINKIKKYGKIAKINHLTKNDLSKYNPVGEDMVKKDKTVEEILFFLKKLTIIK